MARAAGAGGAALLHTLHLVICCTAAGTAETSPCTDQYADWLSHTGDFVRADQPRSLPGLHVACVWAAAPPDGQPPGPGERLRLEWYRDAVAGPGTGNPRRKFLPSSAGESWFYFRQGLRKVMRIEKRSNGWKHLEMKQPFGVFGAGGQRLATPRGALDAQLIFVVEGGQWYWPPVRVGFRRELPGLGFAIATLSVQPVVFSVQGFLRDSECDEIIRAADSQMSSSPVVLMDKDKGKAAKEFRTSSQARVPRDKSPSLWAIDDRVGALMRISKAHNEEAQILRYNITNYYSAHLDNWDPQYYSDGAWFDHGHRNRLATVFWYLNNVSGGGQTLFPRSDGYPQPQDMWSCARGLKVQPVRGTVIVWYSLFPNGNTDPNGLHAACPVETGVKWAANYWVWNKPRGREMVAPAADLEEDAFALRQGARREL